MNKSLDINISELNTQNLSLIGITTTVSGFALASHINKLLGTQLTLKKDFESYCQETCTTYYFNLYYYYHIPYHLHNLLISTHNDDRASLLNAYNAFDYVYILIGRYHARHAQNFINKVKQIENVSLVKLIPISQTPTPKEETKNTTTQVINIFNEVTVLKTPKQTAKASIPPQIDTNNLFDNIEYNIDNITNSHRIFIAFKPLLTDSLILKADTLTSSLSTMKMKKTAATNYHLTIAFFDTISRKRLGDISLLSAQLLKDFQPIDITIDRISYFEQKNGEIVVYFSVKDNPILLNIVKILHSAYTDEKIYFDNKKTFMPHITICRIKPPIKPQVREKIIAQINSIGAMRGKLTLTAPMLFESLSINNTTRYNIVKQF